MAITELETDPDVALVASELRDALRLSGLTQAEFAAALGTSSSRLSTYLHARTNPSAALLVRAQRLGSGLAAADTHKVATLIGFARVIRERLALSDDFVAPLRIVIEARDRLRDAFDYRPDTVGAWHARVTTGDARWDALLAGVLAHEFSVHNALPPAWMQAQHVTDDWFVTADYRPHERVRATTPRWLAERRIYIAARDLGSL